MSLQQAHYNDHRDDDSDGSPSPAQIRRHRDPDIDHELFGLIPNRPGIERQRTRQEQRAFEAECDDFNIRMGWA